MNTNNLYQVLKVDKNASQELVLQKCKELVKKDVADEIGIAALVLADPAKRAEYDKGGFKKEWEEEWNEQNAFRRSIFDAIVNHKNALIDRNEKTPDGIKVFVFIYEDLDPSLWAPCEGIIGWIDKIWDIFDSRGANRNWKEELEDYKKRMIKALDQAYEKNKKSPFNSGFWERVEGENCAKCGQTARLRRKGTKDGKAYPAFCSHDCYDFYEYKTPYEIPREEKEFTCMGCHQKGKDVSEIKEGEWYHKACFAKHLEDLKNPNKSPNKNELKYKCSNCHKEMEGGAVYGSKDNWGNEYHYCSETCLKNHQSHQPRPNNVSPIINELERFLAQKRPEQEITEYNRLTGKTTKKQVKRNPIQELLEWMKKEGITNIALNSQGNLVIEYGSRSTTLKDSELTNEQKEIKEFFQTTGENHLSRNALEQAVKKQDQQGQKPKNDWIMPAVIIGGIGIVICILIGMIIHYRNKRARGY